MYFLKQKEIKMTWFETIGYSLLYAYVFFGAGYFIAKIRKKEAEYPVK